MACILRPGIRAWTNGRLPFTIRATGFTAGALARINNAIAHWNTNTNWQLSARTTQTNYVQFRIGDGCSSPVGRQGGRQAVNLSNNCSFGAAVHEIGHALGFHHEQNRRDRNNHVIVMADRVEPDRVGNFTRISASSYLDHGPYDYGSIMHYGRRGFLRRKRYDWSSDWSNVRSYSIAGETYLFMLKTNDGVVHGHRMDAALGVGREIQRFDWSSGWTTTETFTAGTSTYLFLLKQNGGTVHTRRLNNDGTVGSRVDTKDWSNGWTTTEFWRRGASTFLFLLKRSSGVVHIHRMNANGRVGTRIATHDWSSGWSSAKFYRVGGQNYLFLLKASNGTVHIHRMNNNGTVGSRVDTRDWSNGWTSTEFYTVGGTVFLFLLKRSSGIVHIHAMRNNGRVGNELLLTPPINIFAPQAIGQRGGLSPGDIAAANDRL